MENHQDYILSKEKLLSIAVNGTKDFKIAKEKEIYKMRQFYSNQAFEKQHMLTTKGRNESTFEFDQLLLTEEKRKI